MDNFNYDVEISVPTGFSPNTNNPIYNEVIRLPDKGSWSNTLSGSSATMYPFVTEFIARKHANYPMDTQLPLLKQEVGYAPYSTLPVYDMDQNTINGFLNNIASFILYGYLIVFVYIANELAGERESKSREGMKMMGL